LPSPKKKSKIKDVEDYYSANSEFSFNSHIFYSFDLCGSCESHAILASLRHNHEEHAAASSLDLDLEVETVPSLADMDPAVREMVGEPLRMCP
jgi:hypothetical protein